MVLLILYFFLIILNILFPKNKALTIIDFVYMWILIGWSYGNADYNLYVSRYSYPDRYVTLEPLYVSVEKLFSSYGYDYESFLLIMSFICLLIKFILINKMSSRQNIVIAMYLLFPFLMDIVQIRSFYASTLVMVAIYVLLQKKKFSIPVYIALILFSTMIHSLCIVYLVLIIAVLIKTEKLHDFSRKIILAVAGATALLVSGILYKVLYYIATIFGFGTKFAETVIAAGMAYKVTNKMVYMAEIILFFLIANFICLKARKMILSNNYIGNSKKEYLSGTKLIDFCYKSNYLMLIILPFAWFSGDIYRIQHIFMIILYIAASNVLSVENKKKHFLLVKKNKLILNLSVSGLAIVFAILFTLLLVSLRETVFLPAFFSNRLIGE